MAKKKVVFAVTDGIVPKKSADGRAFDLFLPMDVNIPANSTQVVKLGVSCDVPAVVSRKLGKAVLFSHYAELTVEINNTSREMLVLGARERVAQLFTLDSTDIVSW